MGTLKKAVALLSAIGLMCVTSLFAATGWTRVDYTSSTTFVGFILVSDGYVPLAQAGDSIGAFVGTECRMKDVLKKSPNSDTLWVSAILHGGDINPRVVTGETVTFKIWHKTGDKVADLANTTTTIPEGNIYKFPLGKTAKSTDATVAAVAVKNATLTPAFAPATLDYKVELANGASLPVAADYTITLGSSKATVSTVYATDFATNNKTVITVTAEDGSKKVYTITFSQAPCTVLAPTVDATVSACAGTNAEVTATSTLTNATFTWKNEAGTVVGTDAKLSTSIAGDYSVTQTVGCTGAPAKVTVSIVTLDAITLASTHALSNPICESATVDLAGIAIPAGGVYSGTGVTGTSLSAAGLAGTGKIITYTITKDNCSSKKDITFDVVAKPTPSLAGLPAEVCKKDAAFALTGGTPANGTYSIDGNNVTSFDPALYSGAVTIKYTVSPIAGCSGIASSSIAITTTPVVTAKDQIVVVPGSPKAFDITLATGATAVWYKADKTTVIAYASANFTPTETTEGVYQYYVSQKIGNCESELTPVSLTITPCNATAPTVTADKTVCAGEVASFTATPVAGSEIIWKKADGTVISTAVNTYTPATDTKGTYLFYASQKSTAAASCESPQTKVSLVVNEVPVVSITIPSTPLTTASAPVEISVSPAQATLSGTGISQGTKTFDPAKAGQGSHTLTAELTVLGCTGTKTATINVGTVVVDNTALLKAISDAELLNAVKGYAKGQYIDEVSANSALASAISAATAKSTSTDATELATALSTLTTAVNEFKAKANPVDYTALKEALDAAEAKVVVIGTNVGSTAGQYLTSQVDALKSVIPTGKALYGTSNVTTIADAVTDIKAKTDISVIPPVVINYEALKTALAEATNLLATKTEGSTPGTYQVGALAALATAKNTASEFTSSTVQGDVTAAAEALVKAIADFQSKLIYNVNTDALQAAIKTAEDAITTAKQGTNIGEYYNLVKTDDDIVTALAKAKADLEKFKTSGTVEEVATATTAIKTVTDAFVASKNKADLTALVAAINAAEEKFKTAQTNVGTANGQYYASDVNTLQAAIETAKGLLTSSDETTIGAGIVVLNEKANIKPINSTTVDYTALNNAITIADAKLKAAVTGTAAGEYTAAIKTAYEAAIATANAALKSADQDAVTKAALDLSSATAQFIKDANKPAGLNYTDLTASIDSATSLSNTVTPGYGDGEIATEDMAALTDAISAAETAKSTAKTQTEVDKANKALKDAIALFNSKIITSTVSNSASIDVYPTLIKESVTIEGLTGTTTITICNTNGIVVTILKTDNAKIEVSASVLAKGNNTITTTSTDGTTSTTKVIVE